MTLEIRVVRADHPDARRLIDAYLSELAVRLGGFDPARSVSAEPDEMSPPDGVFLVAYEAAEAVACGGVKRVDAATAEIKRMFVAPGVRGRGLGRRILEALEAEARARGYRRAVLDTAAPLEEASRLYLSAGYREVEAYNDNPYAARWFEKSLGP